MGLHQIMRQRLELPRGCQRRPAVNHLTRLRMAEQANHLGQPHAVRHNVGISPRQIPRAFVQTRLDKHPGRLTHRGPQFRRQPQVTDLGTFRLDHQRTMGIRLHQRHRDRRLKRLLRRLPARHMTKQ